MSVAWQFTAWKPLEKAFRPVGVRHDNGSNVLLTAVGW
jgi:hypothetical protein